MQRHIPAEPSQRATTKAWAAFHARKYGETLKFAEQAERLGTRLPDASFLKAAALSGLGRHDEALVLAEAGVERYPDHASFLALMGSIEMQRANYQRAIALLRRSLDINPEAGGVWQGYASALFFSGDFHASRAAGLKALEFSPNDPVALGNYASALRESGSSVEALPYFRKACAIDPRHKINRSNLLLAILYDEHLTASALRKEAQDWAQTLARSVPKTAAVFKTRPGRIRIGILSNDLRRHACAYFLIPLIANLDRRHFEVVLISLNAASDVITEKIKQYADAFLEIAHMSEHDAVRMMREEALDVMVDLGGYTGASPLQYMVHRLAPVQLTWLGYPGTTGMSEVQYRVTDWTGDPEGFDEHYTETLLRAPVFCAYHAHVTNPLYIYEPRYRVQPTPALANGHITFGSCNSIAKLTPKTIRLWSAVLARCAGSKLLVEAAGVEKEEVRDMLATRFTAAGIDMNRVIFLPRHGANQYVTYHSIDIALDTAPVTGGTTTCDALWMGVPVVSLAGETFHQRVSAPFLHAAGLDGLICESEQRYVEVACELAADVHQLDALRTSIRQRVEQSAMSDAAGFAQWFEDQLVEALKDRKPIAGSRETRQQGVYFAGTWYPVEDLVLSVAAHLHTRDYAPLMNVLENLTSTWHRHWMVAYALAEVKYHTGDRNEAITLLIESIGLRPYSLPLYRLLAAWLSENDLDLSGLAGLLEEQFGIGVDVLMGSPVPDVFEILGIQVERIAESQDEQGVAA